MQKPNVALNPSKLDEAEQKELSETALKLVEEFKPLVESRRKLQETEQELRGLLVALEAKITALSDLKQKNIELEREVLTKIRSQL